ncbi:MULTISPECIES: LysR substrate-binding domain-containing protein [unclassified Leucobacter]|uniref:LysR substrate-binding domain-containing protein n=1 Tax=unclassified Leucobacter TaxID=2621730 RepID=UPI001F13F6FB|nr:LysR substrate-binding domain-containing protein [Leucobacter sp. CX169]
MNETPTTPATQGQDPAEALPLGTEFDLTPPPLRLGFARGIAPSKWERRWRAAVPGRVLEMVPLNMAFGRTSELAADCDVVIERTAPGEIPEGAAEHGSVIWTPDSDTDTEAKITRHAMFLYTESMGLVVPKGHELADEPAVRMTDIAYTPLLDHPDHSPEWPDAEPWADPAWMPKNIRATLQLVATGAGSILMPIPLARHLINKKEHVIIPIIADPPLIGSSVWATWRVGRDSSDVQQLAGILRGRTSRSSRPEPEDVQAAPKKVAKPQLQVPKKPQLKRNSRGAQLAAVQEKAERNKAIKRLDKRKKK